MASPEYFLCAACGDEAIYDGFYDERPDVVVIHAGCYSQIALKKILPLDRCMVCDQLVCRADCPNRARS